MPNLLERPGDWAIGRAIGLGVYELIAARVRRLTSPNNRGSAFRASASARALTTEMECVRTKIRGHLVELFQRRVLKDFVQFGLELAFADRFVGASLNHDSKWKSRLSARCEIEPGRSRLTR